MLNYDNLVVFNEQTGKPSLEVAPTDHFSTKTSTNRQLEQQHLVWRVVSRPTFIYYSRASATPLKLAQ